MKSWKRLLFYLVLNVIVSACTVLVVLFAWDQLSGPIPRDLLPKALQSFSPQSTPIPTSLPAEIPAAQAVPTEEFLVYQVQEGDTFESLAEEYGISVEELIAVNGFTKSQPLGPGEVLRIPIHPAAGVIIESVVGAGDLDSERVHLEQQGAAEVSLVGWRMEDEQENIFIFPQFPQLILYPRGAVNVYTKAGSNTVIEIYWGLNQPVWGSGETVTLKDPQGNVVGTYKVP
jgi:LysM repeat protein